MSTTEKKGKVGIFYWSRRGGRKKNAVWTFDGGIGTVAGYVRLEVLDNVTLTEALDMAMPQRGESVMNAHWVNA